VLGHQSAVLQSWSGAERPQPGVAAAVVEADSAANSSFGVWLTGLAGPGDEGCGGLVLLLLSGCGLLPLLACAAGATS
jgi:hypothetical protein